MRSIVLAAATIFAITAATPSAQASRIDLSFAGSGVSGFLELTYGTSTDSKYPNAFVVTAIAGNFSDPSIGIVNAAVGSLIPVNFATPEPTNLLAPHSFSRAAVASGLPAQSNGFVTYDNLVWPGGSSPTATDYPVSGGALDIYGLLFGVGDGRFVNLWSNGDAGSGIDYGVSVSTSAQSLQYLPGGLAVTVPEPASFALFGTGLVILRAFRRRGATPA